MQSQSIIRVQKNSDNPFVMIDKRIFSDNRLSWKAKGILGYLLSKPDNWKVVVGDLVKQSTDGRTAIYSGLKELIENGYIERKIHRGEDGRFTTSEYVVYEVPHRVLKPEYGKPACGKSDTTNNDITNNEFTNIYHSTSAVAEGGHLPYSIYSLPPEEKRLYTFEEYLGVYSNEEVNTEAVEAVRYFIDSLWRYKNKKHCRYSPKKWKEILEKILWLDRVPHTLGEVCKIIDTYFSIEFREKCNYHITHLLQKSVAELVIQKAFSD